MTEHPRLSQFKKPPNLAWKISYNRTDPNKGQCLLKYQFKLGAKLKKKKRDFCDYFGKEF